MSASPPVRRRGAKLAERIAHEIVQDITAQGLKPGDRLPSEVQMAQDQGVSRTSLREALRILELQGVITIRTGPNGGPELTPLDAIDFARMATLHYHMAGVTFRQLLDVRMALEPRMAELAAVRRTPEQLAELRSIVDKHDRATDAAGMSPYTVGFHEMVTECAGEANPAMSLLTSSAQAIFRLYTIPTRTEEFLRDLVPVHAELCDAIEEGDGDRARVLMEEHMRHDADTFAQDFPRLIDSTVPWLSS